MTRIFRLSSLCAFFGIIALAACGAYPVGNPKAVVTRLGTFGEPVPLVPYPDWAVVEVAIGDTPGFRFLVDTGATPTGIFLSNKVLALGLAGDASFAVGGAGEGSKVQGRILEDVDLTIAGVRFSGLGMVGLPPDTLPPLGDAGWLALDGVIGYDLYSRFAVTVDPVARTLSLSEPGGPLPEGISLALDLRGSSPFVTLPVRVSSASGIVDAELHLDTGMTSALQLRSASHPGLATPTGAREVESQGLQGIQAEYAHPVDTLWLGGHELAGVMGTFAEQGDRYLGRNGRIGAGALGRFRHTIDYRSSQMVLAPVAPAGEPFRIGRLGMAVFPYAGTFVVRNVTPGTPAAAAGLREGDELTMIGSQPVAGLTWLDLDERLAVHPGETREVCLTRDATETCYRLTAD